MKKKWITQSLVVKGSLKHNIEGVAHLFQDGGDFCIF